MTIQEAIQKAVEGGFMSDFLRDKPNKEMLEYMRGAINNYVLAPSFWQALGKSMGWGSGCNVCLKDGITHSYANGWADECEKPKEHLTENHKYPWQINWHRLIDHLAEGKYIEDYFKSL